MTKRKSVRWALVGMSAPAFVVLAQNALQGAADGNISHRPQKGQMIRPHVPVHGTKASLGVSAGHIDGASPARIYYGGPHISKENLKTRGPQLGFFGTLGYVFDNNLYLGGEVGYLWANTKDTICDTTGNGMLECLTLKMGTSWDFVGHVGYAMSGFLPFIKFGAAVTKFKGEGSHGMPNPASGSTSKYVSGFQVGAGIDIQLTDYLWGGLSYDYTWYPSFWYMISTVHNVKIHPRTNTVRLRLRTVF